MVATQRNRRGHINILNLVASQSPYAAASIGRASRTGRSVGSAKASRAGAAALKVGQKWRARTSVRVKFLGGADLHVPFSLNRAAFIRKYNAVAPPGRKFPQVRFIVNGRHLLSTYSDVWLPLREKTVHAVFDLGGYHRQGLDKHLLAELVYLRA